MRGSVVGCVVSQGDGAPIPEAKIEAIQGPDHELSVWTDAVGSFVLQELPAGDWLLAASAGGRRGYSPKIAVFDDAATSVTIEMPESMRATPRRKRKKDRGSMPTNIRGHVRNAETDQPVADATVVLDQGPGPAPDIAAVTDSDGSFSFHGLMAGQWLVVALSPDGERGEAWVDASGPEPADVTIRVGGA
jgi:uncharacterized GH25 family protein